MSKEHSAEGSPFPVAKDSWLQAEIVGNGLWPQQFEAIAFEMAHALLQDKPPQIRKFNNSALSPEQLHKFSHVSQSMHSAHHIEVSQGRSPISFEGRLRYLWSQTTSHTLVVLANYASMYAKGKHRSFNRVDIPDYLTAFFADMDRSVAALGAAPFFNEVHEVYHSPQGLKLSGRYKDNLEHYTEHSSAEKKTARDENKVLRHQMACMVIDHFVARGYKEYVMQNFVRNSFMGLDPSLLQQLAA